MSLSLLSLFIIYESRVFGSKFTLLCVVITAYAVKKHLSLWSIIILPLRCHYSMFIRKFGPLVGYWTNRFESKHRVAKNIAASSKNVINISKTLAIRQQMRMSSGIMWAYFTIYKILAPLLPVAAFCFFRNLMYLNSAHSMSLIAMF